MVKKSFFKFGYAGSLIAIITIIFVIPVGSVFAQSSACGVSGEGLCQSSCGPYDDIISPSNLGGEGSYCSQNEQCCVPSKCASSNIGLGECKDVTSCGDGTIGKNTSDCTPPKLCCITPKIIEITCPGGVCTEDNTLNNSLSSVCVDGFESDFCEEYKSNCDQDPNSLMCEQTLIDLTNNEVISTCAENPQLSNCLTACAQGSSSEECQTFLSQSNESGGLVPESCPGFDPITREFKCSLCSVFELIKNIIDWLVGFVLAISVGFIVWAGISMMFSGGDSGALSKAKEMATTAVIGVALALGGWLIVGTLLGALSGSDKIMPWNKITCTSESIKIGSEVARQSASCTNAGGVCQNTKIAVCSGTYKAGLCPGSSDIKCCISTANIKIEMTACSKILNGAYECREFGCPGFENEAGICGPTQTCCDKKAPVSGALQMNCSDVPLDINGNPGAVCAAQCIVGKELANFNRGCPSDRPKCCSITK